MPEFDFGDGSGVPQDDFDAILAAKVGAAPAEPDTLDATDATPDEEPDGPARGPDGRFLPKGEEQPDDTPDETDDVQTPPDDGDDVDTDDLEDDDLEGDPWQVRYGEAQKVIGRQGQELGELRERLARLEAGQEQQVQQQQAVQYSQEDVDELVAEHGGHSVAVWALQQNRMDIYDQALNAWALEEPIQAQRFDLKLQTQLAKAEVQSAAPAVQDSPVNQAWVAAVEQYPDLAGMQAEINKATEGAPKLILTALASGDVEQIQGAIEALRDRAIASRTASASAKAAGQSSAAARQAKAEAARAVAPGGSLRNIDGDTATQTTRQIQEFKQNILSAPSTDIESGLTRSGA